MTTDGQIITLQPLDSIEFLSVLRSFLDILCSCRGPKAGVKILVSGGGINTVTSSSCRLLSNLVLSNPLCIMISQIMKSQLMTYGDYGLYCGILDCSLMEQILTQDKVPHSYSSELVQYLNSNIASILELNCVKLPLNFSSVKELLPIIETILSSKPACGLNTAEMKTLSMNIVKAFLKTVDEENLGEVMVLDGETCRNQSSVFNGVLYQTINEEHVHKLRHKYFGKHCDIPLLLFNIMLSNCESDGNEGYKSSIVVESNNTHSVVEDVLYILKEAVKLNVGIVACQKVVHSDVHLYLQRNNIVLLDRMGTELTKAVEKLSGAKPISSLEKFSTNDIQSYLGHVQGVELVKCNKKQFILLEKGENVATLLLSAPNEEATKELQAVTRQALQALRQLVYLPYVTPGAGCLEASISVLLQLQISKGQRHVPCQPEQLKFAVGWLQKSLLSAAGFRKTATTSLSVDSVYFHLWQEKMKCCCGLISYNEVENYSGQWIEFMPFSGNGMLLSTSVLLPDEPKTPIMGLCHDTIYDIYSSKRNALKLALESCLHMLSIGIVIYRPPV